MPWYNFIDPVFLHRNKKKQSVDMFGVFEKYIFSNIHGSIVIVRINITENDTKLVSIKLRKKTLPIDNKDSNDLNENSYNKLKKYSTTEFLNENFKDKPICIKNLVRDKNDWLKGDIYIDNILINHLISPPCKKRVTFSNIDDSIVSLYTLIKSKVFNLFN